MSSTSSIFIPASDPTPSCLRGLSLHDQGLFLLERLAFLCPRGKTFRELDLYLGTRDRPDPNGLVPGVPSYEVRRTIRHLFDYPWREIVRAGYIAEAPPGSGRYEITDEGWAVVKSNTVEVDDDYIDTILP